MYTRKCSYWVLWQSISQFAICKMPGVFVPILLTSRLTERPKLPPALLQNRDYLPLFSKRHCLPAGSLFSILVGVQSSFAADGFIEAEHSESYGFLARRE